MICCLLMCATLIERSENFAVFLHISISIHYKLMKFDGKMYQHLQIPSFKQNFVNLVQETFELKNKIFEQ